MTSRCVIARPVVTLLVSSMGASAVTVTDSVVPPTSSWTLICNCSPKASVMPERTDRLKPGFRR